MRAVPTPKDDQDVDSWPKAAAASRLLGRDVRTLRRYAAAGKVEQRLDKNRKPRFNPRDLDELAEEIATDDFDDLPMQQDRTPLDEMAAVLQVMLRLQESTQAALERSNQDHEKARASLLKLVELLDSRNARLEEQKEKFNDFRLQELQLEHQQKIEELELEAKQRRLDGAFGEIQKYAPAVAAGLLGKLAPGLVDGAPPGLPTPRGDAALVIELFSTLDPGMVEIIRETAPLTDRQREILDKFFPPQPAEENPTKGEEIEQPKEPEP